MAKPKSAIDSFGDRSVYQEFVKSDAVQDYSRVGVAELRYERLNMQVIETIIHKASGF